MKKANYRVLKLQETIQEKGLDAILVFGPANRRYLSGFAGSTGYAIITKDSSDFLVDFRYWEQAATVSRMEYREDHRRSRCVPLSK